MVFSLSRRSQVIAAIGTLLGSLLLLHLSFNRAEGSTGYVSKLWPAQWASESIINEDLSMPSWGIDTINANHTLDRARRIHETCHQRDDFEHWYGRTNLRMSRGYEGSHYRIRKFIEKVIRGENVTISVVGGSVTRGHGVYQEEVWFWKLHEWMGEYFGPTAQINKVNGAAPAVGSDYFSFCFPLHIPTDSDLVFVELGVNDEGIPEHVENMENLIRGLLSMETTPAVVLVEAVAFSNGGMGGGGGRMHLPVAQYYDVPVINQRHPLANHFARYPELIRPYFAQDYWGIPDTRHINRQGHKDLGNLIASFIRDVSCGMLSDPDYILPSAHSNTPSHPAPTHPPEPIPEPKEGKRPELSKEDQSAAQRVLNKQLEAIRLAEETAGWPEWSRTWPNQPNSEYPAGRLMPGLWNTPAELGLLPRLRILNGWNSDLSSELPPFHPTCLSTRSTDPRFNLTPTESKGWTHWTHPEHLDKPYLIADKPGSWARFDLSTSLGIVKVYALKSRTFGLGDVWCWIDNDREGGVMMEGYWDHDENIGRFVNVAEGLPPGPHSLTCELMQDTHDPEGGTEFRMISVMAL